MGITKLSYVLLVSFFMGCTTTSYRLTADLTTGLLSDCNQTNHMEHEKVKLLDRRGCSLMLNPLEPGELVDNTVICTNRNDVFTVSVTFFEKEDQCFDMKRKLAAQFANGVFVHGDIKKVTKQKFGVKYAE